jgi:fido (protein-threonine AMPylation protein)
MSLTPDYGETLLPHDELDALLPIARSLFSEPIAKAAVYDLEQGFEIAVKERYLTAVLEEELSVDELLDDYFVRRLHGELYGDIWSWAGAYRKIEVNIGIAPEQIAVELRSSLHTLLHRWQATKDWTPRQLGIAAHAETVRIHPFTDGNGRTSRLFADLVFLAAQTPEKSELFDWERSTSSCYDSTTAIAAPTSLRHSSVFSHSNRASDESAATGKCRTHRTD